MRLVGFLLSAFALSDLAHDLFDLAHIQIARDYFVGQALGVVMAARNDACKSPFDLVRMTEADLALAGQEEQKLEG